MKRLLLLFAITLFWCTTDAYGQIKKEKKVEKDGFVWYEVEKGFNHSGAQNAEGRTIIPTQYYIINYKSEADGWFTVMDIHCNAGAYEKNGKCIISTNRGYLLVSKLKENDEYWYLVMKGDMEGACDANGKEIISPNRGYERIFRHKYEGLVYYSVEKGGMEGVCDANGNEIIAPRYESVFYSESKHEFICKDSNGNYMNKGISLKGSSYASSSSSSSSSSSGSSTVSSPSNGSSTSSWKHQGWYLDSNDGIDINTGRRMSEDGWPTVISKTRFTIYEDHLEAATETDIRNGSATKVPYIGMENGWRVYRSVSGGERWRMDIRYYVNSNNDIKHIMNNYEYPTVKDGENIYSYRKLSSGSSGGYSGGSYSGSSSSSNSRSSSNSSSSSNRIKCPNCEKGRRVYESSYGSYCGGLESNYKRCGECGKTYDAKIITHHHGGCTTCHGSGYLD